jgi:CelD/BcsL family acetyltransferase involved in cellulose biosynthesis
MSAATRPSSSSRRPVVEAALYDGALDDLLPEWKELFAADCRATPFQSPAWVRAWGRHWARGMRPWIVVVRRQGRLVGLAPLWRERALPHVRSLRAGGEPADYWDLLALPDARGEVEAAVAQELRRRRGEWDALNVMSLPPGSTTAGTLERCGLHVTQRSLVACPGVVLPDSFDAYLATLPSRRRTNLRRRLRHLDEGELELRVPRLEDLPNAIDRWQALRVTQWGAMGKQLTRAQTTHQFRDFLVDVVAELIPAGRALVWEFVRAGEVVGSFVNFCDERTFYQYVGAFAPELGGLAIGKIATAEGIRSSIAAGREYYDFMRGAEDYKYWYGAQDRLSPTVVFASGGARSVLKGRAGVLRDQLVAAAERLRSREPPWHHR